MKQTKPQQKIYGIPVNDVERTELLKTLDAGVKYLGVGANLMIIHNVFQRIANAQELKPSDFEGEAQEKDGGERGEESPKVEANEGAAA